MVMKMLYEKAINTKIDIKTVEDLNKLKILIDTLTLFVNYVKMESGKNDFRVSFEKGKTKYEI